MEATERIKGYCTEVNKEQWEELVRVAHENGVDKSEDDKWNECYPVFFIDYDANKVDAYTSIKYANNDYRKFQAVKFPDFLAKLRGVEEWMPKAGEMVLIDRGMREENWVKVKFIGYNDAAFVWFDPHSQPTYGDAKIVRPLNYRPTITRAEAEAQLGKRIID